MATTIISLDVQEATTFLPWNSCHWLQLNTAHVWPTVSWICIWAPPVFPVWHAFFSILLKSYLPIKVLLTSQDPNTVYIHSINTSFTVLMSTIFPLDYCLQEDGVPYGQGHCLLIFIYLFPCDLVSAWHTVEVSKNAWLSPGTIMSCFER